MKRSALIASLLALSLAACGEKTQAPVAPTATPAASAPEAASAPAASAPAPAAAAPAAEPAKK